MPHSGICALTGSSVVIPCSFTHRGLKVFKVYWVKKETQNGTSLDLLQTPLHEGRAQYSMDMERNCTLALSDVRVEDAGHYYITVITYPPLRRWLSNDVILLVIGIIRRKKDKKLCYFFAIYFQWWSNLSIYNIVWCCVMFSYCKTLQLFKSRLQDQQLWDINLRWAVRATACWNKIPKSYGKRMGRFYLIPSEPAMRWYSTTSRWMMKATTHVH